MPIRHEDSVDHWHNTSAFPVIFLDKFHSSGNMTHTIYNCFTWFNIYYIHSKRQRNLKDLVSVELKGDKSTEGCQTLENSRKCTKQSYTPYVLSLQIIVQYSKFSRWGTTENRGRELLLGVLSGVSFVQTSAEKDEKAAESPTWLGYQKILLHLCRLGGVLRFRQRSDKKHSEAKHHWPGRGGPEGTGTVSRWRSCSSSIVSGDNYPGYTTGLS